MLSPAHKTCWNKSANGLKYGSPFIQCSLMTTTIGYTVKISSSSRSSHFLPSGVRSTYHVFFLTASRVEICLGAEFLFFFHLPFDPNCCRPTRNGHLTAHSRFTFFTPISVYSFCGLVSFNIPNNHHV